MTGDTPCPRRSHHDDSPDATVTQRHHVDVDEATPPPGYVRGPRHPLGTGWTWVPTAERRACTSDEDYQRSRPQPR